MRKIKASKKITALILGAALVMPGGDIHTKYAEAGAVTNQAVCDNENDEKEYVITSSKKEIDEVKKEYSDSIINDYSDYKSDGGKAVSVRLSDCELRDLSSNDNITIEEDVIVEACKSSKDKKRNIITSGMKQVYLDMIDAPEIHEKENLGQDERIKVAVIDSGVSGCSDVNVGQSINLIPGEEEMTTFFEDETGHGTSIAGIIAGNGDDTDVVGINKNVSLYSAKVLDANNCAPVSRIVEGIYWAIDNDVDIINMSFGTGTDSEVLRNAVEKAIKKDILVVAAVGNDEQQGVLYPAAYDGVLGVGSVDTKAEHSDFSATGDNVDVVAVGEQVVSTGIFDGVVVAEGTSMAVPQVVAEASIIMEHYPDADSKLVQEVIKKSANYLGAELENGSGLINIERALNEFESIQEEYEKGIIEAEERDIERDNVETYELKDCVAGQWTRTEHANMVTDSDISFSETVLKAIVLGAKFNDYYSADKYNSITKQGSLRGLKFAADNSDIGINGDWHGRRYIEKNDGSAIRSNYIASARFAFDMAMKGISIYDDGCPSYMSKEQYKRMKYTFEGVITGKDNNGNDVKYSGNSTLYSYMSSGGINNTYTNRKAFALGMSMHILGDIFAHSAHENDVNVDIDETLLIHNNDGNNDGKNDGNNDADNTKIIKSRNDAAKNVVKKALKLYYNNKDNPDYNTANIKKAFYLNEDEGYRYNKYAVEGLGTRLIEATGSLSSSYISIIKKMTVGKIENAAVTTITNEGYYVECTVPYGTNKVDMFTWTVNSNGADIRGYNSTIKADGITAVVFIPFANYSNKTGLYATHIYLYKDNQKSPVTSSVMFDARDKITDVRVVEQTSDHYTIEFKLPITTAYAACPTWTIAGNGDDVEWKNGSVTNGVGRVTIYRQNHYNRSGYYVTDIYAMNAQNQQIDSYRFIFNFRIIYM